MQSEIYFPHLHVFLNEKKKKKGGGIHKPYAVVTSMQYKLIIGLHAILWLTGVHFQEREIC